MCQDTLMVYLAKEFIPIFIRKSYSAHISLVKIEYRHISRKFRLFEILWKKLLSRNFNKIKFSEIKINKII